MKITKSKLKQLIKEEMESVVSHSNKGEKIKPEEAREALSDIYGAMMNLLRGRGEWEKAGGSPDSRQEAYKLFSPYMNKLLKVIMKL